MTDTDCPCPDERPLYRVLDLLKLLLGVIASALAVYHGLP
jgi:hypothetical protein